ncbi:MAG TPA: HD-GYP domain-containing protein, partial [Candidatus Brocadiales bacterium]|nr:HD-GYP domain-containing protein [Candidatus Brocadiales bacterium]
EENPTTGQREATASPSIPASPTPNRMRDASMMQYGAKTLSALYIQSIRALVNALELKDGYTATHSYMVSHYAAALAVKLGLPQDIVEVVRTAGLLHDVGKVGVPDGVLKKNGPLSSEEFTVVKTHPVLSIKVLNDLVFLRKELEIVRYHQEKYDGTGYPYALKGDNIPLGARILAICDTFEAMTANRPYRKALPVEMAVAELKKCAGTQFDPKLVKVFVDSLPEILSTRQIYLEGLRKTVALPQFSTAEGQASPPSETKGEGIAVHGPTPA